MSGAPRDSWGVEVARQGLGRYVGIDLSEVAIKKRAGIVGWSRREQFLL